MIHALHPRVMMTGHAVFSAFTASLYWSQSLLSGVITDLILTPGRTLGFQSVTTSIFNGGA